jgi:hypothetical protein
MAKCASDDFDRTGISTPMEVLKWLRQGLADWRDPRSTYLAFEPIGDRFDPTDDAEPQIRDMFEVLPEWQRLLILEGIALGFEETEPSEDGLRFFDSLQRLVRLLKRQEPAMAMVVRVTTTDLLDHADSAVARHLYAGCFVTLAEVATGPEGKRLVARLVASPRFREEYGPFIVEQIGGRAATHLLEYVGLLLSGPTGVRAYDTEFAGAIADAAQSLSPLDLMVMLDDDAHLFAMPTSPLDEILRDGFEPQMETLTAALTRIEMAHRGATPTSLDYQFNDAYLEMSREKSRALTRGVRRVEVRQSAFRVELAEEEALSGLAKVVEGRQVVSA